MKLRSPVILLSGAAALFLSACSSADFGPLSRSASDSSPLADTADKALGQVAETRAMAEAVSRSADELLNRPSPNLNRQYKEFAQMVERFDDSFDDLRAVTTDLENQAQEYFIGWDKEIATMRDESIRQSSAERRAAVQDNFDELRAQYSDTRARAEFFLRRMRDIESALGQDLTSAGVEAVRPNADNLGDDTNQVVESLNALSTEFRDLGLAMAPSETMTEQRR